MAPSRYELREGSAFIYLQRRCQRTVQKLSALPPRPVPLIQVSDGESAAENAGSRVIFDVFSGSRLSQESFSH